MRCVRRNPAGHGHALQNSPTHALPPRCVANGRRENEADMKCCFTTSQSPKHLARSLYMGCALVLQYLIRYGAAWSRFMLCGLTLHVKFDRRPRPFTAVHHTHAPNPMHRTSLSTMNLTDKEHELQSMTVHCLYFDSHTCRVYLVSTASAETLNAGDRTAKNQSCTTLA